MSSHCVNHYYMKFYKKKKLFEDISNMANGVDLILEVSGDILATLLGRLCPAVEGKHVLFLGNSVCLCAPDVLA